MGLLRKTVLPLALFLWGPFIASSAVLEDLRCEYQLRPLGIDRMDPRFSWMVGDADDGFSQKSYRIIVGTDSLTVAEGKGDMWDSGEVFSSLQNGIRYAGKPFQPQSRYYWCIRVVDNEGKESISCVEPFETAMWSLKQWKGRWIEAGVKLDTLPAPYFRKEAILEKEVLSARAYVCGLGYYELSINGKKVGDQMLAPVYSNYSKVEYYQVYDVTTYLHEGDNALGMILGNGWLNFQSKTVWHFHTAPWRRQPRFIMDIRVVFKDGSEQWIISDESWKVTLDGPIRFNSNYSGEYYDARMEMPGWNSPGFDDASWKQARQVRADLYGSRFLGILKAQQMPPIRQLMEYRPVSVRQLDEKTWLFDMGVNCSGLTKLKVRGSAGTTLSLIHSDWLEEGEFNMRRLEVHSRFDREGERVQGDRYTLKGVGMEEWMPRFAYHGYQYVLVSSDRPVEMGLDNIVGVKMNTDLESRGRFECSDPLLNRILDNGLRSYESNFHGIPTDCPHREKNGWTGDAHIACEVGTYYYDTILAYEKYVADISNELTSSGELPSIAPSSQWGFHYNGNVSWDAAFIMIPWYMYLYYGDPGLIERHYPEMVRFMDYLEYLSIDDLQPGGLNDWCPYKTPTPAEITSSGNYYRMAILMSRFAKLTGREEDCAYYDNLARRIKKAFNAKYWDESTESYTFDSQTALAMVLFQDMVPEDEAGRKVASRLDERIRLLDDEHLDFGLFGSKYVLNALSDHGYGQTAYIMASQPTFPSWGYWAEQGYTTFHEAWNSGTSRNHIMFGEICAWMQKALAGIKPDPDSPGYRHFTVNPGTDTSLEWVKSVVPTVYGDICLHWRRKGKKVSIDLTVPPNTSATLQVGSFRKDLSGGRHHLEVPIS